MKISYKETFVRKWRIILVVIRIMVLYYVTICQQKKLPWPMPFSCRNFRASRSCFPRVRTSLSSNFLGDFFPAVAIVEEKYFL